MRRVLLVAAFVLLAAEAFAADVYVSKMGSNAANDCRNIASPCLTLQYAWDAMLMGPGDTLFMCANVCASNGQTATYDEGIIDAAGTDLLTRDGRSADGGGPLQFAPLLDLDLLRTKTPANHGAYGTSWAAPVTIKPYPTQTIKFQTRYVAQVMLNWYAPGCNSGGSVSTPLTCNAYLIIGDATGSGRFKFNGTLAIDQNFGSFDNKIADLGVNHLRFYYVDFEICGDGSCIFYGNFTDLLLSHCNFGPAVPSVVWHRITGEAGFGGTKCRDPGAGPGSCWDYSIYNTGNQVVIEYSTFFNFPSYAIHNFHSGVSDGTPGNNIYRYNTFRDFGPGWIPAASYNSGDTAVPSAQAYGSYAGAGAILMYTGWNNAADSNVIENGGGGFALSVNGSTAQGQKVLSNTMYSINSGVIFRNPNFDPAAPYGTHQVRNNIYTNSSGAFQVDANWALAVAYGGNLCAATATGCNATGSPSFVNAGAHDYRLALGSAAIDIGVTLGAPYNLDKNGVVRVAPYDAGAYDADTSGAGASIAVSTASLAGGTVGDAYSQTISVTGGTAPYACGVSTGTLPTGLALSVCTISGTPTIGAFFSFSIVATDSASHVSPAAALTIDVTNAENNVTDDFTATSTQCLHQYSTNWIAVQDGGTSNCVAVNGTTHRIYGATIDFLALVARRAETFSVLAQRSSLLIATLPADNSDGNELLGVCTHAQGVAATRSLYSVVLYKFGTAQYTALYKITSGAYASLATTTTITWAPADRIELRSTNGVLRVLKNGVAQPALDATDPTPLTGGSPCVAMSGTGVAAFGNAFIGGELTGGAQTTGKFLLGVYKP